MIHTWIPEWNRRVSINFEDNVPDIGVVMSEVVLRHYGYNVYNAGSHAELGNIEKTLDLYKIDSIFF